MTPEPILDPTSADDKPRGDPDELQRRVGRWIEQYEALFKGQQEWLKQRAQHWLRWHGDPSIIKHLREGIAARQNNEIVPGRALADWQNVCATPYGAMNEWARTTSMSNLVVETDPMFKARARGVEDLSSEWPIEMLVNHELAMLNSPTRWVRDAFTRAFVQGPAPMKATYRVDEYELPLRPRTWDIALFKQAVEEAIKRATADPAGGDARTPPGVDPNTGIFTPAKNQAEQEQMAREFVRWQQTILERYELNVPMPPVMRTQKIPRFVGVKVDHIALPDLTWDQRVPEFADAPVKFQRLVIDKEWLLRSCKQKNEREVARGRRPPFNLQAIADLPRGVTTTSATYESTQDMQQKILSALGIDDGQHVDPALANAVEVIEVWQPRDADTYGWCWIGQRKTALTEPGYYPLAMPIDPYFCHFHIPTPGLSVGRGSYDYLEHDHDHINTMRGLLADGYTIKACQPIARRSLYGEPMGARELQIRPFQIVDAPEGVEYVSLFNVDNRLEGLHQYIDYAKREIDQFQGIGDVQRGESATLNRVGVGEVQARSNSASNRPRDELYRFGAMCSREAIPLTIGLVYQDGAPEHVMNVSGGNPFEMMATENLLPALSANYMVMPAVLLGEAALLVQQLQETTSKGLELGVLVPAKKAANAIYSALLSLQRVRIGNQIMQLAAADQEEAKSEQQAAQEVERLKGENATLAKENDALRRKIGLPTIAVVEAETAALEQPQLPAGGNGAAPEGVPGEALPPPQEGLPA